MEFARDTEVPIEKSKMEIERTLTRYGATEFLSGWKDGQAVIGFRVHDRMLRFVLPLPNKEDFRRTPERHFRRNDADTVRAWEQGQRQRWRALALVIKAKLEAVQSGISTFEREFLGNILMANGQTVYEWTAPAIKESYATGGMPALALPERT